MPILVAQTTAYGSGVENEIYVRKDATGDVVVGGDLSVGGELYMTTDISNSTGLVHYDVSGVDYPLYPSFVKIISPATITKQTTQTKVAALAFTIPQTGYYSMTAQISLASITGSTATTDTITIYGDLSGESVTPLNGAINTFNVVPNAANAFYATSSGVLQQKLNAGQIIEFYHLESGAFGIGVSSSIGVTYTYLGNKAI